MPDPGQPICCLTLPTPSSACSADRHGGQVPGRAERLHPALARALARRGPPARRAAPGGSHEPIAAGVVRLRPQVSRGGFRRGLRRGAARGGEIAGSGGAVAGGRSQTTRSGPTGMPGTDGAAQGRVRQALCHVRGHRSRASRHSPGRSWPCAQGAVRQLLRAGAHVQAAAGAAHAAGPGQGGPGPARAPPTRSDTTLALALCSGAAHTLAPTECAPANAPTPAPCAWRQALAAASSCSA
jgi:hypothetical protein